MQFKSSKGLWGLGQGLQPAGVIKQLVCSPNTLTIQVRIPLKSTVLFGTLFEKNENKQTEVGESPF